MFQDFFSSGAITSATDFQIYKEIAGLSGLDFAYTDRSAVYHTKVYLLYILFFSFTQSSFIFLKTPFILLWIASRPIFLGFNRTPYDCCFYLLLSKNNQVVSEWKEIKKSPGVQNYRGFS